ncbi:MAG: hypothetical protein H2040_08045 [Euryhalocaulis sp.]|uniref:hypothetical protein n=1 Tax=Euryhalocaulis sp. TaxID=2744307 RepID=UPI00181F4EB6|nr:hypothetical protein [Euryhalocaulis sp.]MBA4801802.1 hypothetical protein [Euryhalocaulis sp.]
MLGGDYFAAPAAGQDRPVIPDAAIADLNRLQLIYETDRVFASIGRQIVRHGDQRFIGNSGWRQDDRTFDAARIDFDVKPGLTASYSYVWKVNQTLGTRADSDSDSHLLHLDWVRSGAFKASGFAYLIDLDDRPGTATFGARATGDLPAGPAVFTYDAVLARQQDYRTSADFTLDHAGLEGTITYGPLAGFGGFEHWEGDGTRGFDLPFAGKHARRGWADVFSNIPAEGVEDLYLGAKANWPRPPFGRKLGFQAAFHSFDPTRGGADFGHEWNAEVSFSFAENWSAGLQYADYDGGAGGPADRKKLYLSIEWQY